MVVNHRWQYEFSNFALNFKEIYLCNTLEFFQHFTKLL